MPLPQQLDTTAMPAGLRLAVGLSGGADSVALLRASAARAAAEGWVLHAAHFHHGLRGAEADEDQAFCASLAGSLKIPFHTHRVDAAAEAAAAGESIEAASRRLRYGWFRRLMHEGIIEAVATAHSLDDQAETVLGKLLRGAWTEGISGIHPVVHFPEGRVLRPMLPVSRAEVEAWLHSICQNWREDSSNQDQVYTRNRIRHQLLPQLEEWNPQIRSHLATMAELARDEEAWWQDELARRAPELLLSGRPVRGGGRAQGDSRVVAVDVVRLAAQPVALQRRLLRHAAERFGLALSFEATERLRKLATGGTTSQKLTLSGSLTAERTPRELRLATALPEAQEHSQVVEETKLPVPGEASAFGWRFRAEGRGTMSAGTVAATIRVWKAGDKVNLRYSSGPRKVKEVLERLKVYGSERAAWPVVAWKGRIVWMQGAVVEPVEDAAFTAHRE